MHQVTELILRSLGLQSLCHSTSLSLTRLDTLSLSHNNFSALANFGNLSALRDLNMNFNKLNSEAVKELINCKNLEKLFLSNNCIDDGAFKHFPQMKKLNTLCLFKNKCKFLMKAQNCVSGMESLVDASFEGNPLSFEANYKYAIIRSCRCIKLLDGEEITELDQDFGDFVTEEEGSNDNYDNNINDNDDCKFADFTDGSISVASTVTNSKSLKLNLRSTASSLSTTPRSEGINTDPVLLTYRASALLNGDDDDKIVDARAADDDESTKYNGNGSEIEALANEITQNRKQSR